MARFDVAGPLVIPCERRSPKFVEKADAREFWDVNLEWADKRGVYVFGVRAGPGITPIYVGKATRTFRQEVFTSDKLHKLNGALREWRRGTPIVFLLHQSKGPPAKVAIAELEAVLILLAEDKNPKIRNTQGRSSALAFEVVGVTDRRPGAPSYAARDFKRMLDWGA